MKISIRESASNVENLKNNAFKIINKFEGSPVSIYLDSHHTNLDVTLASFPMLLNQYIGEFPDDKELPIIKEKLEFIERYVFLRNRGDGGLSSPNQPEALIENYNKKFGTSVK